ncbi:MAG: hypothetical protein ACREBE_22315, partial [bacterium]
MTIDRIADYSLLQKLSNLFSATNVAFVVVTPPHVRETWLARRDAGYEDIPRFHDIYLPAKHASIEMLLREYIDDRNSASMERDFIPTLGRAVTLLGGGTPSGCMEFIERYRQGDVERGYVLTIDDRLRAQIEYFARLVEVVQQREVEILGEYITSASDYEQDRARRFLLTALRWVSSKGSISMDLTEGPHGIAENALPADARAIMSNLTSTLSAEGILAEWGDRFTLSATSRSMILNAGGVLASGLLPALPVVATEPSKDPVVYTSAGATGPAVVPSPSAPPPPPAPRRSSGATQLVDTPPPGRAPGGRRDSWNDIRARLVAATNGDFTIIRELGRGGMAAVYLARENALDREVAIKVMSPVLTFDAGFTERFQREARTLASLHHPNIIT